MEPLLVRINVLTPGRQLHAARQQRQGRNLHQPPDFKGNIQKL